MASEGFEDWVGQLTKLVKSFPYQDVWQLIAPFVWSITAIIFLYFLVTSQTSATIRYTVPPPKYPEGEPEILVSPSIKVSGSSAVRCYSPATGQLLGLVNPSTPAGIDRAIEAATAAQAKWAKTTFAQRRAVLKTLLQYVLDNQEQICRVSSLDSGKTMLDAQLGEILVTTEKLQWTINHGEKALQPEKRPTNLLMTYKQNKVVYEPMGVVAALVSWNYPFHNLIGPIISAIFAGNGIVVKVSEQTCWSSTYYTSIVRGALVAHGQDPALVQTVVCWPSAAEHLTSHPGISHITFIGSKPVCHHVAASAARTLTPVLAELGGKDAAIITDSAKGDLKRIADTLMRGSFQAAGQNCIGIERIIAAPGVYDKLVSMLEPRAHALRLGVEKDVGAMVSDASFSRLEALVEDAVAKGARLLAGGKRYTHPDHPSGFYFTPTLVAEDLLKIANAPDFGLGASVWGRDSDSVVQQIVRGVRAGGVAVNDFAVFYAVQLPFGGVGGSGYGRFAGEEGLRGLCNIKSVCEDRWGWLGIRTAIPPAAQYPIRNQDSAWRFAKGVVGIGYGIGLRGKIQGLVDIVMGG
ncbi:succinate-semialdehyde dehydrogenase- variant [Apiospora phragmitis]|uniref:aldehyde dehydrogenase (NAD(+)) n=1 Tax=Apiospora phragmitis TaxID=2905665 RepID=A0ABR1VV81_9PEZI